jgi:hypothetical protein
MQGLPLNMPEIPELSTTTQVVSSLGTLFGVIITALIVYIRSWAAKVQEHRSDDGSDIQIVGGALADRTSMRLLANAINDDRVATGNLTEAIKEDRIARQEMTVVLKEMVEVYKSQLNVDLKELEERRIAQEIERRLGQRGPGL